MRSFHHPHSHPAHPHSHPRHGRGRHRGDAGRPTEGCDGACRHHHPGDEGFGRQGRGRGHGRGEGRGGRRRQFESAELRLVLLKLIADQPRHGYDMIRAVEELTGGAYAPSPGVVYPTLTMLEEMGHIEKTGVEGSRKAYSITAEGTAQLDSEEEAVQALFARLAALAAATREGTDSTPIRRAMDNLRAVLMNRLGGGAPAETIHAATAILDDAAQRIERLP